MVKVVCLTDLKTGSSSRMTSIRRPRSSACTVSSFRTTPSITRTLPPLSLTPRAAPEIPAPVAHGAARINPPAERCPLPRGASASVCPHRRLLLPGGGARIAARGRPLSEPPAEPRRARAHHGGGGPPFQPGHGLPARADRPRDDVLAGPLAGARAPQLDVRRHRADLPGGAHRLDVPDADRVSIERPARPLSAAHPGEPHDSTGRGVSHPHLSGRHPLVPRHDHGQRRGLRLARHRLGDLRALQRPGGVLRLTPCPTTPSSSSFVT